MRRLVWALALTILACGRVGAHPKGTITEEGGSNDSGGGGASTTTGGKTTSTTGGNAPIDRGGQAMGATAGTGGVPAASGGVPAATAGMPTMMAGAPSGDDETYDACGCGCCGVPVNSRCYYPDLAEDLVPIKGENEAAASSPECANAGCAAGVHYVRCVTPDVEEGASYSINGYMDSASYLQVARESAEGRCNDSKFVQPGTPQEGFPIELPLPGRLSDATDRRCSMSAPPPKRTVIGTLGYLRKAAPGSCKFDFDFTVFFLAEDGTADPVRFKSEGVALAGMEDESCP